MYKLKSFLPELTTRKLLLWIFDLILVLFIFCASYYVLTGRKSVDTYDERFIVFEEDYEVRNPGMAPAELVWRVEQSLVDADVSLLNNDRFPALDGKSPVLVVQAGRRAARLQQLLASLAAVDDVSEALLVVSHSFYDEALVELVRSVDYCRVLQVFYPFSRQLFPDRFPGPCPAANRSSRVAAAAEHKQHWWWTAHFLFNHYTWIAPKFSGLALFLQEDDYVAPDVLHMLRYAQRGFAYHPEAEVISLGRPAEGAGAAAADYGLLTLAPWQPLYERGLAFNGTLWRKVLASAEDFCFHDDASWSYSLLNVFAASSRGYVDMLAGAAPRVLSTGLRDSGRRGAAAARAWLAGAPLFPARVRVAFAAGPAGRVARPEPAPPGAGDWADLRDQLLCLDPFLMTTRPPPPAPAGQQRGHVAVPAEPRTARQRNVR